MAEGGMVYLAGAGPGGAGSLTRRCAEVLAGADAVLGDAGLPQEIFDLVAPHAEWRGTGSSGTQWLLDCARRGERAVRLYRDDPFASGEGVEDARRLAREGIPFEVIPGPCAGVAAAAFAGIPVGGEGAAGRFAVVYDAAGRNLADGLSGLGPFVENGGTLVVVTEAGRLGALFPALSAAGFSPEVPLAVIQGGGTSGQRVCESALGEVPDVLAGQELEGDVAVAVGQGCRLRAELRWLEERSLHGRRVLITRPKEQAGEFASRLRELGAEPLIWPAIRLLPPEDWAPLDAALDALGTFDWVIFTSPNGVRFFAGRLFERGGDARAFGRSCRVVAIGPGTARALEEVLRIRADTVPERYIAEGILEAMEKEDVRGKRILIPRAWEAREVLPEKLGERGARVEVVPAYRTLRAEERDVDRIREELAGGRIDMVAFTSSSAVRSFFETLGEAGIRDMMPGVGIASIGPVTSETVRSLGLRPSVEADESTIAGLARAIAGHYRSSAAARAGD